MRLSFFACTQRSDKRKLHKYGHARVLTPLPCPALPLSLTHARNSAMYMHTHNTDDSAPHSRGLCR